MEEYLELKKSTWILFDNVDKGWSSHGIDDNDLLVVRCLIDALQQFRRALSKRQIECHAILFLRDDVYQQLLDNTPDRGKITSASVDWRAPDLLREMLRRRLLFDLGKKDCSFPELWNQICVSHISGEESSQYVIDRSLMRPRALIDLCKQCKSHAVNLSKLRIDEEDIIRGEEAYSMEMIKNISYEIRDIFSDLEDVLYHLLESPSKLTSDGLDSVFGKLGLNRPKRRKAEELLLWFGVLGVVREHDEVAFIYDMQYDMKKLQTLVKKRPTGALVFGINPAFWKGLEVKII